MTMVPTPPLTVTYVNAGTWTDTDPGPGPFYSNCPCSPTVTSGYCNFNGTLTYTSSDATYWYYSMSQNSLINQDCGSCQPPLGSNYQYNFLTDTWEGLFLFAPIVGSGLYPTVNTDTSTLNCLSGYTTTWS